MKTFADVGIQLPPGAEGEGVHVVCPECGGPRRKPEHRNDRDLSVNTFEGAWLCHHCGWKGSLKESSNGYGSRLKQYERPPVINGYVTSDHETVIQWFESQRGISRKTVERNKITATRGRGGVVAASFPYFRGGEHVHTTYRTIPDKGFYQSKGTERIYYGLDDLQDAAWCVIVEGQCDKLAFEEAGFLNVISVPDGAPAPDNKSYASKFTFHDSAAETFERMDRVYLATDSDAPGRALAQELSRRVGAEKCLQVTWPDGCKDANQVLIEHGPGALISALTDARPWPIEGVTHPGDLRDRIVDLYHRGADPGVALGFPMLDQVCRFRLGSLAIITGHYSHGKSTWIDHIISAMAREQGWRTAIFSPENAPLEEHLSYLAEIALKKPFGTRIANHMSEEELLSILPWLDDHFDFVHPEYADMEAIIDRAAKLVRQRGINVLVIDPWNRIAKGNYGNMNETQFTERTLPKLTDFAQKNNVLVMLMAHPTKIERDADGKQKVVELDHINGSIHFANMADYGISIYRDMRPEHVSDPSQCHILKVRKRSTGKQRGMVPFKIDWATRTLKEVTPE